MATLNLDGLSRDEQFAAAAQYSGVPEAIIRSQWQVESSQGRNTISEAGARGDFQVMPSTQAALEVRNKTKYNSFDFSDSLNMYAQLMKENLTAAKGDLGTAVAMYHGGTDRNNWGPRTQDYVSKVTGASFDGGGVNLPANGYSWKGGDIEAAWRGDPIASNDELRAAAMASASSRSKDLEDSVLRGMRDQASGLASAAGGNTEQQLAARQAISQQGSLDMIGSPTASANTGVNVQTGHDAVLEQQERDDAARKAGLDWTDQLGSVWDSGPLGAAYRAVTQHVDWSPAPQGWSYDPKVYEKSDYSPEELEQIRAASYSPQALGNVQENIIQKRYTARVQSDMTPWQQIASGVVGGFTDPVGAAAGFGVGVGFRAAGVGATQLFKQGRLAAGIAAAGAEGAAGNVAADFVMEAAGEHRSAGDYLTDAAFGIGFGILGAHGDIVRGAARRRFEQMANDLHADGVKERETAASFETSSGDDPAPAYGQANNEASDRWAKAGMQNVPENDRIMPRPDTGDTEVSMRDLFDNIDKPPQEDIVAQAPLGPGSKYVPPEEFSMQRGKGTPFDSRIRDGWVQSVQEGNIGPVLKTIAGIPEMPEDYRLLAQKLSGYGDLPKADGGELFNQTSFAKTKDTAGLYMPDSHSVYVKSFNPEFILHEAVHAFTVRELGGRNPQGQLFQSSLEKILAHVNEHLPNIDREGLTPDQIFRVDQGKHGFAANTRELLAYGFTNRDVQDLLKRIPSTAGKNITNAWEWFKDAVRKVLGINEGRSALDDIMEVGGGAIQHFTKDTDTAPGAPTVADVSSTPRAKRQPVLVNAHMNDPIRRAQIFDKYDLQNQISDNAMRLQVGEYLSRAEGIVDKYSIDPKKLKTILPGVLKSDSTVLGMEDSVAAKAFALMFTENGQGAWERINHNAALDMRSRQQAYEGTAPRVYNDAFNRWAAEKQTSRLMDTLKGGKLRKQFAHDLSYYRESLTAGNEQADVHPLVKEVSDALDAQYNMMAADGRLAKITGWASLPEEWVKGYGTRHWAGEKVTSASKTRRGSMIDALTEQLRDRMEFQDTEKNTNFVRNLAVQYFERITERHSDIYRGNTQHIANFNNADIMRDALKAMGLSEEEVMKNLDRFTRGGAGFTRGRFDLDMVHQYSDAEGPWSFHDYLAGDPIKDFKRYSARMSGEVAASRHGMMGDAGIDVLRTAMRVSGTSYKGMEAFDRVAQRYVGRMAGDRNPDLMQAINNWSSASAMGGGIWNQLGEYLNAVPTVGMGGVAKAAGLAPEMRRAIRAHLKGEHVEDNILSGLEEIGGAKFGFGDYDMYAGPDFEEEQMFHGPEGAGILTRMGARAAHAQHIWTGQRLARAVQTRGLTKVMVEKVLSSLKYGHDMSKGLRDIGLTDELVAGMKASLDDVTKWKADGTLDTFDPRLSENASHDKTWASFYHAVQRGANQMIQGEFVGETGEWASKPLMRFMMKFRTFSLIAHQKQLGRVSNLYGPGAAAAMTIGAMGMAVPLYAARVLSASALMSPDEREKYLKQRLNPLALGRASMNYVSTTGLLGDMADLVSGVAGGWASAALGKDMPEWAKPQGGRSGSQQDLIGGTFGPGIGFANDVAKFLSGSGRSGLSAVPFSRTPYMMPFYQGLQSAIKEKGPAAGAASY